MSEYGQRADGPFTVSVMRADAGWALVPPGPAVTDDLVALAASLNRAGESSVSGLLPYVDRRNEFGRSHS